MIQSIDDIVRQARQGSVSAIIQVLNEKLVDSGIRTRAMLDDGMLQLLCEAETADQLEQTHLVKQVKQLLEGMSPRNISRVNINSRLVREQQLLWLDEIKRDPESQLLWSQEVRLRQPSWLKRWQDDRRIAQAEMAIAMPQDRPEKKKSPAYHFWRGLIVGGTSLGLLALLVGWAMSDWLGISLPLRGDRSPVAEEPAAEEPATEASPAAAPDPFVRAVRLAEQAATEGREASTRAAWLSLASRWQEAADLMAQVASDDPRYSTAQDRIPVYRQNSSIALQQAEALREATDP